MISLFVKVLPLLFIAYFILRYFKDPIYLLGIPFLMFLRDSIFFPSVRIFYMPARFSPDIFLAFWLFVVWAFIIVKIRDLRISSGEARLKKQRFNQMDYLIILLIVISSLGLIFVLNENYLIVDVLTEFITLVSLFLGYFIVKSIVSKTKLEVLSEFLFSIVVINSIASLLYFVHQGLQITLYTSGSSGAEEYLEEFFQGEVITRTFWFMPFLWFFSVSYLLAFTRNKPVLFIPLLSINLLAIFISYTRSFLVIAVLIIVAYFLLTGFKEKNIGSIIKNMMIVGVTGVVLFLGISAFLPASKNYFLDRFKELDDTSADAESNTLLYRIQQSGEVINRIDNDKILIGHGPVTEVQMPFVKMMRATTADMSWTGVVFRWGYLGLILFAILYIGSIIKAFLLFLRTDGLISQFAILLLLVIISQLIESFTSSTFMSPYRFALGLWYFAILSAILTFSKDYVKQANNESSEYGKS